MEAFRKLRYRVHENQCEPCSRRRVKKVSRSSQFRFFFAYNGGMEIGGYEERHDWPKLGPSLLIATCLLVAIRTARWPPVLDTTARQCDLDQEIDFAAQVSGRVLALLVKRWPTLYPRSRHPWYKAEESEQPK